MKYRLLSLFLFSSFFLLSQDELKLERIEGISTNERIDDIEVFEGEELYVAGSSGIYNISSPDITTTKKKNMSNNACIAISRKGDMYSATKDGKVYCNNELIHQANLGPGAEVRDMAIYKGKLWIASSNGLVVLNLSSHKLITTYKENNSKLKSSDILFVHSDRKGKLWLGTKKGFAEISDDKWKVELTKEKFVAIAEVEEGVFLLSDKDLILIQNSGRLNSMGLSKGLSVGEVNDLTVDAEGYLYVASDVLIRYDPYRDEIQQYSDLLGIVSQKCLALASDDNLNLWLGTSDAGLFRIFVGDLNLEKLQALALVESPINCHGDKAGSIVLNVSGGEAPYTFAWDNPDLVGESPINLAAGDYTVTITDKFNNKVSRTINILEPDQISFEVIESTRVSGPGKKDGSCRIDIKGGTAPYLIAWESGEIGYNPERLKAGIHQLTITDANECKFTGSVEIEKEKYIPDLDISKIIVGQTVKINNLFFEADSSNITEISYEVLDEVYEFLAENDNIVIEIGGHTNNKPPHEYCDKLSTARAKNVAGYLYNKGIGVERIGYKGYGKRKPKYSNRTKDGQRKNQRVEVKIVAIN